VFIESSKEFMPNSGHVYFVINFDNKAACSSLTMPGVVRLSYIISKNKPITLRYVWERVVYSGMYSACFILSYIISQKKSITLRYVWERVVYSGMYGACFILSYIPVYMRFKYIFIFSLFF